eukprot:CAMPEP_0201876854 /NCGR_PEP_ID=MMETSP0902-20130614/8426_1 /ASSEMBLY_ACC=CAM_ASM_000551 /TAXON_ID=420261 /ORGANISM="Thalassiosira antarctica, Strain CCMP982" /LENGTH=86 /DNA_ID=CAMNT_0048404187 /DNA_START=108 /DNA_END=369 /DNA_ORIENTATION=+
MAFEGGDTDKNRMRYRENLRKLQKEQGMVPGSSSPYCAFWDEEGSVYLVEVADTPTDEKGIQRGGSQRIGPLFHSIIFQMETVYLD